jgi:predicted protein tyrosine phosphatase
MPETPSRPAAAPLARRLTICGIAELEGFHGAGVSHVLSLLDPGTPRPPALAGLAPRLHRLLEFHDVTAPFGRYAAPQIEHVESILAFGRELAGEAAPLDHLLVHCHMGISRSTAAMAILLAQGESGGEARAFDTVFAIRPRGWPNSRMIAIADRLLGRGGALEAALRRHQQRIIEHHPDIADLVINVGRGDELPR